MFVFASDIHASDTMYGRRNFDTIFGFEAALVTRAYLNRYAHIARGNSEYVPLILGGDIFDSAKISSSTASRMIDVFFRYPTDNVYYINGNHDNVDPSWMDILRYAIPLEHPDKYNPDKKVVTLPDGTKLAGMSWHPSNMVGKALEAVSHDVDFLVAHQYIEPVFTKRDRTEEFQSKVSGALPSDVFSGFRAVLAGDIHKAQCYPNSIPPLAYPGCTSPRDSSEVPTLMIIGKDLEEEYPPAGPCYDQSLKLGKLMELANGYKAAFIKLPYRGFMRIKRDEPVSGDTIGPLIAEIIKRLDAWTLPEYNESFFSTLVGAHSSELKYPWILVEAPSVQISLKSFEELLPEGAIDFIRFVTPEKSDTLVQSVTEEEEMPSRSTQDYIVKCLDRENISEDLRSAARALLFDEDAFIHNLKKMFLL